MGLLDEQSGIQNGEVDCVFFGGRFFVVVGSNNEVERPQADWFYASMGTKGGGVITG